MKKLYRSEAKTYKRTIEDVSKDIIEKQFIFRFFQSLPLDKLKEMIKFEELDFNDKALIERSKNDIVLKTILSELKKDNCVKYICEIEL